MKCSACGNENHPGAKFCVHCGVVLNAVSAPPRALAPTPTPPPPGPTPSPHAAAPEAPAVPAPPHAWTAQSPSPAAVPSRPALASAPPQAAAVAATATASSPKLGLIVGGIAILIVLLVGGYAGYRLLGGPGKETVAAVEAPKPAQTAAVPAPVAPDNTPAATPPTAAASEPAAIPAENTKETAVPTESPQPADAKAARTKAAKGTPTGPETPQKGQPPQTASASAPGKAKGAVAAAVPAPDRWQMFAEAMAQCGHLDFFSRIGCEQRQRWHYCEGYWGHVPQCPGAPTNDHPPDEHGS